MAVSLSKGGNVSLTKEAPGLKAITVGLGWDARTTDGSDFDLDASVFLQNAAGKVRTDADFIFYNQREGAGGAVVYQGDNRTGAGAGDDEQIEVELEKLPADVAKIAFTASIYEADSRRQNFGMVSNAYIRVINRADGSEIARYDLSEDAATQTAMIFGELYRYGSEWKFRAVGQGFSGGLKGLAENFSVNLA